MLDGRIVLGAAGSAAGIALAISSIQEIAQVRRVRKWPSVVGHVSSVQPHVDGRGRLAVDAPGVHCAYQVNGTSYDVEVAIGGREHFWVTETDVSARYTTGKAVRVHYDPNRPSHCVLRLTPSDDAWLVLGIGALIAVLSPLFAYLQ